MIDVHQFVNERYLYVFNYLFIYGTLFIFQQILSVKSSREQIKTVRINFIQYEVTDVKSDHKKLINGSVLYRSDTLGYYVLTA